jgi:hypothetical protein
MASAPDHSINFAEPHRVKLMGTLLNGGQIIDVQISKQLDHQSRGRLKAPCRQQVGIKLDLWAGLLHVSVPGFRF